MKPRIHAGIVAMFVVLAMAPAAIGQAPGFRSFTPESGPPGTLVKIIGERLDTVTEVRFHGVKSASVRVVSPGHLKAVVPDGATTGPIELVGGNGVSIELGRPFFVSLVPAAPPPFYLARPWPSPAPGSVTLGFSLPATTHAQLLLFDVRGRQVRVLVDGELPAGPHEFLWDGTDEHGRPAANGIYFVQLRAEDERRYGRLALIRR